MKGISVVWIAAINLQNRRGETVRRSEIDAGDNKIAGSVMKWYKGNNLAMRYRHMKKNIWLLMVVSCAAGLAFGCAAMTGVPQGSVLLGTYDGSFNGAFNEGSIEIKLYQTPDGRKPFFGNLEEDASFLNFRGEMTEDELQGQILLPSEGTISGKLSSDGKSLSGTYKLTLPPFDHGTWQARKY